VRAPWLAVALAVAVTCSACGVAGGLEVDHRVEPRTVSADAAPTGATAPGPFGDALSGSAKRSAPTATASASLVVPASTIAYADGIVWGIAIEPKGPSLFTIDVAAGTVVPGPAVAGDVGAPGSLAVGNEGVWLVGSRRLVRVDPRSGRTVASVPLPATPGETIQTTPLVADGSVFAAVERPGHPGTLIRADGLSGAVRWTIAAGSAPAALTTFGGSVWLADAATGSVLRIDEATGLIRGRTRLAKGTVPLQVTAYAGAVWVIAPRSVSRLDPETGKVVSVSDIPAGYEARTFAAGAGAVWAVLTDLDGGDSVLQRLRPHSGAASGDPVPLGYAGDIVTGAGAIWIVEYTLGGVIRLDPS